MKCCPLFQREIKFCPKESQQSRYWHAMFGPLKKKRFKMTLLAASHMCSADAILGSSFTVGYFQHASFFSHWTGRTAEARSFFGSPPGRGSCGDFYFFCLSAISQESCFLCVCGDQLHALLLRMNGVICCPRASRALPTRVKRIRF